MRSALSSIFGENTKLDLKIPNFGLLPILSVFPVIEPDVGIFKSNFVFCSKYTLQGASNELSMISYHVFNSVVGKVPKITMV